MIKQFGALVGGIVLTLVGAAFAVSPGGFPSRPQLGALGVGTAPGATGTITATGTISTTGTITTTSNFNAQGANQQFGKTSGNPFGVVSISAPGTTYSIFQSADSNGNVLCVGLNHSASAVCNLPANSAGIGSSDVTGLMLAAGSKPIVFSTTGAIQLSGTPSSVPWAGAPVVCTSACSGSGLAVGQSLYLIKGTATSRASQSSVSVDPDLQVTNLPFGQYVYDVAVNFSAGASAGGYRINLDATSSCTGINAFGFIASADAPTPLRADIGTVLLTPAGSSSWVTSHGIAYNNGSFNGVAVCWSQSVSNATALTVQGGGGFGSSSIAITRIQ